MPDGQQMANKSDGLFPMKVKALNTLGCVYLPPPPAACQIHIFSDHVKQTDYQGEPVE
jgi:hypothetical protein